MTFDVVNYRAKCAERQKRYYAKKKDIILEKRKIYYENVVKPELIKNKPTYTPKPIPVVEPTPVVVIEPTPTPAASTEPEKETIIKLTPDVVIPAFKAAVGQFGADSNHKLNIENLKVVYRAINNADLYPYLLNPYKLYNKFLEVKQISGKNKDKPYASSGISRFITVVGNIKKLFKITLPIEAEKTFFEIYKLSKLEYELQEYHKKTPVLNAAYAVESWDDRMKFLKEKHGSKSLVYLVMQLYNECPLRDDYSNIILVKPDFMNITNKNYMIVPPDGGNAKIIINKHKTQKNYGALKYTFSPETTKIIRDYISEKKIQYNSKFFGKLPLVLHAISGAKNDEEGGTRLIRRMIASTLYDKYINGKATSNDIVRQIILMEHKSSTHFESYIYAIKNDKK